MSVRVICQKHYALMGERGDAAMGGMIMTECGPNCEQYLGPTNCKVPECSGGYIRVPVIVTRNPNQERYVEMQDIECLECLGTGRRPS